jgi:hypothetical protein
LYLSLKQLKQNATRKPIKSDFGQLGPYSMLPHAHIVATTTISAAEEVASEVLAEAVVADLVDSVAVVLAVVVPAEAGSLPLRFTTKIVE